MSAFVRVVSVGVVAVGVVEAVGVAVGLGDEASAVVEVGFVVEREPLFVSVAAESSPLPDRPTQPDPSVPILANRLPRKPRRVGDIVLLYNIG